MARHGDSYFTARTLQSAEHLDGFVSSDAAGYAKRHALSREVLAVKIAAHL
jgi:hypothetical protein